MAYLYIINSQIKSETLLQNLAGYDDVSIINQTARACKYCHSITLVEILEDSFLKLRQNLDGLKCDYVYSNFSLKIPKLIVFDMDSTLIPIEVIDELANFAGKKCEVSAVTELAMQGQLDFDQSLRQRVSCLKGLDQSVISELANQLEFNPGVKRFCDYLMDHGSRLAIASGGFAPFADALKQEVEFSYIRANQLGITQNKLNGNVVGSIINANEKEKAIIEWAKELQLEKEQTMAIGDGANDLLMIKKAGIGLAYHAKPAVNQSAKSVLKYASMAALIDLFEFAKVN